MPAQVSPAPEARAQVPLRRAETIIAGLRWLAILSWPFILRVTEQPWSPRVVVPLYGASLAYAAIAHLSIRRADTGIRGVAIATTVGDSAAVALVSLATGGIQSDVYPFFHLAVLATALRFGMTETFAVLALMVVLSAVLVAAGPAAPASTAAIRVFLLSFVALLGALLSREVRRHFERALREGNRASLLLSVNREITSTLDLTEVLGRILQEAVQVIPCAGAAIVLLGREGKSAERVLVAGGLPQPEPAAVNASLRSGVLDEAGRRGSVVLNRAEEARERLHSESLRQFLSRNLAVISIRRRETLGFLVMVDKGGGEPFSGEEIELLAAVADQAGVAIENARLVAEVRAAGDRNRALLWKTIRAGEEERRRIAGEIHDRVGASFFELYYGLQRCRETLARDAPAAEAPLVELEQRAQRASQVLREVMNDLRPSVLDDFGFLEALREYGSHLQAQGELAVRLRIDGNARPPSPEVGTMLFRVVQEAVLNVRKHARARNVTLEVASRPAGGLELLVRDDGCGFDPDSPPVGHYGLLYMRERVEACGGTLEVHSRSGQGTEIRVSVPAAEEAP